MSTPSDRVITVARNMRTDSVTAQVVSAFEEAGLDPILLKGPSFARWLYDAPGERGYSDSDLLVSDDDVPAAESVLSDLGFEHEPLDDLPGDKPWHAHAWIRPGDGANVDLHRTIVGVGVSYGELWRELSEHTESLELSGRSVRVLTKPARAVHVALHAAQDGLLLIQARSDLARLFDRLEPEDWRTAWQIARSLDAEDAFSAGIRLDPRGDDLAQALGVPEPTSVETILRAGELPDAAIGLWWMQSQKGLRKRAAFLIRKVFPPVEFMRAWTPLADKGLAGIVLAYLWRPVWLALRAPRAIAAYRQARRRSNH